MSGHSTSLVLIAHGSLADERSNQPLHDLARELGSSEQFDYVTPAFLNGQPAITNVLDGIPPGDVVFVPVMTSQGYYLSALPSKLQQNTSTKHFRFFVSRVLGVHPGIPELISNRIVSALERHQLEETETTVVVVGHGTRRNKNSSLTTRRIAGELAQKHPALNIETAFLDQDPTAEQIASRIQTINTIVIPFLISRGPHSTVDVPEAFGLNSGPDIEFPIVHKDDDAFCICDLPVGMYPEIADLCLQLGVEALANERQLELATLAGGFAS